MKSTTQHQIQLGGRVVYYRLVLSKRARKLRLRVGPAGVEVLQPGARNGEDVEAFLSASEAWLLDQLDHAARLRGIRRAAQRPLSAILFKGELTPIRVEATQARTAGNGVRFVDSQILVLRGPNSQTPVARSLEHWLRREARKAIEHHLAAVTSRLGQHPDRVYVMDQRTKWGNCSARRNLSFNWRLILAPDYVLQYIVTHEAVHLAIPDHSAKFWLTVQSHCRDMEKARQWLCRHQGQLQVDLASLTTGRSKE